jgi:hypothetical protein
MSVSKLPSLATTQEDVEGGVLDIPGDQVGRTGAERHQPVIGADHRPAAAGVGLLLVAVHADQLVCGGLPVTDKDVAGEVGVACGQVVGKEVNATKQPSELSAGPELSALPTAALVTNALGMAIDRRSHRPARSSTPTRACSSLLGAFTQRARDLGLVPSMGSVGDCYDCDDPSALPRSA